MSCRISSRPTEHALRPFVSWKEFDYGILESPWEVKFVALKGQPPDGFEPEAYHAGTLFGLDAELRWRRRRNGGFHLVLVHDRGDTLQNAESLPLTPAESHEGDVLPSKVLLWKPSEEPRIPRTIEYPDVTGGNRPEIKVKHYWLAEQSEPATDPILIMRYVSFCPNNKEKA